MKHLVGALMGLIFLSGCLQTHSGKVKVQNSVSLKKDCEDISKIGDLLSLKSSIRQDVEKILSLTGGENVPRYLPEIEKMSERIRKNVEALKVLLGESWTEYKWNIENTWLIPYVNERREIPSQMSVEKIVSGGIARDDLRSKVKLAYKPEGILVSLQRRGSSLEVCELSQTFGIYLKLTYGTLIQISTHHRLILEEGKL